MEDNPKTGCLPYIIVTLHVRHGGRSDADEFRLRGFHPLCFMIFIRGVLWKVIFMSLEKTI